MKKKLTGMKGVLRTRATLTLFVIALIASEPERSFADSRNVLSFQQRVAYQQAIEEVYWRHRIWPKENTQPKPSLDKVTPGEQIEKKVGDYLHKSQFAADQRGWPITANELQAEIDRIAQHTGQPDLLRELFEALGNDPSVIAECLARPILAERLVSELTRNSGVEAFVSNARAPDTSAPTLPTAPTTQAYRLPEIVDACADDTWSATTTVNAPDPREFHTAVWTGSEMIVWGGFNFSSSVPLNTGGKYYPSTDSWTATSIANAPVGRNGHTAVWTGSEMIIWAGATFPTGVLNTGGRYNPSADSWTAASMVNAPDARGSHTAVWTGSEMMVWGGVGCGFGNCRLNTGGKYNLSTDSWTAMSTVDVPEARWNHRAFWTGNQMIVWGGTNQSIYLKTGGRYSPRTDTWTPTAIPDTIPGRTSFAGVWSGSEMIVWGGVDETFNDTNTGGRYNPINDNWSATSLSNAASPRDSHTATWTGGQMIVWGGGDPSAHLNTGAKYNAAADAWTPTTTVNAPLPRESQTALWTGNGMILWGGYSLYVGFQLNTGGSYCAQPSTPLVQSAVSRTTHDNAGSWDVNLPLSGIPGIECRSGGATSDYTIVLTFLANVSISASPQAAVTSGIGAVGGGGVSNGGVVTTSGNVVTIPLTNVANAQTITITLNNVNGSTNVTIPLRLLIADVNGDGFVNSGDTLQTRTRSGQVTGAANFRSDVDADGFINSGDTTAVRARSGTTLP